MRLIIITIFSILLAACAPQQTVNVFRVDDLAGYDKTGTGSISGQAFLKTRGGEVRYAAGTNIELIPNTPYSRERVLRASKRERMAPWNPGISPYCRVVLGDGEGRFSFRELPAGSYLVVADIFWDAGNMPTGGTAWTEVAISDGQSVDGLVVTGR